MKNRSFVVSLVVIIIALGVRYLKYIYAYLVFGVERYQEIDTDMRNLLITATAVFLCAVTAFIFSGFSVRRCLLLLGLKKGVFFPVVAALICTLPMFMGGYFIAGFNRFTVGQVIQNALWAGFSEELVYRAFIAGLLVRLAKWPFIPAALVSAAFFAYGHIYQAQSFQEVFLVLFVTSGAGVGFMVFYKMWSWNIWFVVGLHSLMNLSFVIFDIGDNALLSTYGNVFRGLTILCAIIASIIYQKRKRDEPDPILGMLAKP